MFFQIEALTYRHPGLPEGTSPALKNISLNIDEGEWVALIGANGSGKTTLARHLNALLQPSSGSVLVNGLDTRAEKSISQIRSLVGMVFQSPEDQIVASLVIEDTAFGPENLALPTASIHERVQQSLEAVGMWEQRERPPHTLSAGQIQRVALAGVLAMQPRCIIFDETTAMLDPVGKRDVLLQMRRLHEQGLTVIMITHSMDEAALADRVVLLDGGLLGYDGSPEALFRDEALLAHCHLELPTSYQVIDLLKKYFPGMTVSGKDPDRWIKALPPAEPGNKNFTPAEMTVTPAAAELIQVNELYHTYFQGTPLAQNSLMGVSLQTHQGMTHGLVGATGCGKSTLLQHFNGLYLPQSGSVRVGKFVTDEPGVDLRSLRRFAGMVFQNPELYFFEQYVGDEIAYGREGLRVRVKTAMETVGLDFELFKDRETSMLSGGEKRKVALASVLALEPELLLLDEPTAGLDPLSRKGLFQALQRLQSEGRSIVLSSHNMDDITALAQEMTVMQQGKSLVTGKVGAIFNDEALIRQAGLLVPGGAKLAAGLRAKGWSVPLEVLSIPAIDRWIGLNLRRGNA